MRNPIKNREFRERVIALLCATGFMMSVARHFIRNDGWPGDRLVGMSLWIIIGVLAIVIDDDE